MKVSDWIKGNRTFFLHRDFNFLIRYLLRKDASSALWDNTPLSLSQLDYLEKVKKLYQKGLPLAYILGKEEFFGYTFFLRQEERTDNYWGEFIPRVETEVIVEKAIEIIKNKGCKFILDLCCGTGCIALSIYKTLLVSRDTLEMRQQSFIFASDIREKALVVCKYNQEFHKARVSFICTDLFAGFKENSFDLIISNPPYVKRDEIKDSLIFEPRQALEAEEDGLFFLRRIIQGGYVFLKEGGYLIVEFGYNQKEKVEGIIESSSNYRIEEWLKDYSQNWRGVVIKKKNG